MAAKKIPIDPRNAVSEMIEFLGSFATNKLRWTAEAYVETRLQVIQRQPRLTHFFFSYFVLRTGVERLLQRVGFDRLICNAFHKTGLDLYPKYK